MRELVRVIAPSRLHFGLLCFARREGRSFGGLGLMVDRPRLVIELAEADQWSASGPCRDRALQFAQQSLKYFRSGMIRALRISVIEAPAPHSGLGSGTQLALSIGAAVRAICRSPTSELEELVRSVSRGGRSAVGSYGFEQGGLIWEIGRLPDQVLGALHTRVEVPDDWRIVLITLPHAEGLSGQRESEVFASLPPVPKAVTSELARLAETEILPAAKRHDFAAFGDAVYRYGVLAGNCFADVQGGPFASPQIAAGVELLRGLGVGGVGQSSWGPTIFAFSRSEAAANELIAQASNAPELATAQFLCTAPNNQGARLESEPAGLPETPAYNRP